MDQVMRAGAGAGNSLGGLIARALTGNAALKQKVYNATLDQVAGQYQKAQAGRKYASEADLNNDRLSALGGLQDAYAQNDLNPGQALLASLAARSADSLKDGDVINAALKFGAVNRSDAGNTQGSNAMLAAVQGKPMDYTKIDQNTAYNPNMTPGQSGMAPTQVGMGDIAAKMAQAAASKAAASNSYASAGEHQAHSRLYDKQTAVGTADKKSGSQPTVITNPDGSTTVIPGGKPNTQELTNAGFYSRMVEANHTLDNLEQQGYDPTNTRDVFASHVPGGNTMMSSTGQQYKQAAMNWIRANLRKESGAAIGKDEAAQEYANYFPQYGDDPAVIQQKAANRKTVENAMRVAAGPASSLVMHGQGSQPQQQPAQPQRPNQGGSQDFSHLWGG